MLHATLPTLEAFVGCRSLVSRARPPFCSRSLVSRSQTAILFQLRLHKRLLWRRSWNKMAVWYARLVGRASPFSQTNARLAGHEPLRPVQTPSIDQRAAVEAAVHPVKNRLRYYFAIYPTNESCSQRCARRIMLLRCLIKMLFASYSSKCYWS